MTGNKPAFPDAAAAWADIRKRLLGTPTAYQVSILDKYFLVDRQEQPSTPQGGMWCQTHVFGNDQYRCPPCGMVWDQDEERPACPKRK